MIANMKRVKNRFARIAAAVLITVILAASLGAVPAAAAAKSGKVTIRVAFYQLDGFFEYDSEGNECGYGVDYLNELSHYEDINWEYVPVDSWEDIGPMMKNGEVDVRMPVSEPFKPSQTYSYTTEDVLSSYHAIMTLKDRTDLYYKDYNTISDIKIAVTQNLIEKTGLSDYFASVGVVTDNLIFYDDYNDCREALDVGEVDALVSNVMDLTDDMKILDKFAVTKNYITTLKESPYYQVINSAMTELKLENPSFQTDLYEAYYPERTIEPFTKEETEYMEQRDSLLVAVYGDRRPVSYYDVASNSYKGIAIEIANEIADKMGVKFKYVPVTTNNVEDMLDTADLVMPVARNSDYDKYFTSSSLLDTEILYAVRSGEKEPQAGSRVGVLAKTHGIKEAILAANDFEIVEYDSKEAALTALEKGRIEAFANSSYVLYWQLDNPRYENLTILHYQSLPLPYAICGDVKDTTLQAILNKVISSISEKDIERIIKSNSDFTLSDVSFSDYLYIYRYEIMMTVIAIIFLILAAGRYNHSRTRYIKQIKEKSREQEQASLAKSNFLSRMSHDMRTPMNAIIGMSYLGEQTDSITELKDYHKKINQSGKYLLGLINDTLDMTKIDNDKMELQVEPYYAADFVNSIRVMFSEKIKAKNIRLIVTTEGDTGNALLFDKLHLQQIFVNLINNAIKFSSKNETVELIIHVDALCEDKKRVTFTVRDYGCGMSETFLSRMYEPFEQGGRNENDTETGTGLGLTIVKKLVDLMGGTISCKSRPGEGTEFKVVLEAEVYQGSSEVADKGVADKAAEQNLDILKGKRVLLCEDHPLNAEIARKLLEHVGMQVEVAENGRLGIEKMKASEEGYYQAVLMDIRMPEMNGLEAARAIRGLNRQDALQIPIIAMTANAFEDDRRKSLEAGMNGHLAKPIDAVELYQMLAGCFSQKIGE